MSERRDSAGRGEDGLLVSLLLRARRERGRRTTRDAGAFTEFVERTQIRLARRVLRLVRGDVHRAQDAVQETYLKVWQDLARFRPERLGRGGVLGWLGAIASNTVISQGRRRRPTPRADLPRTGAGAEEATLREPQAPGDGPARQSEENERAAALHQALADLRDGKRVLLELHYWAGLTHRELARRNGLTPGQVNMRLHAARRELRGRLADHAPDADN